jgi:hypothetical protein
MKDMSEEKNIRKKWENKIKPVNGHICITCVMDMDEDWSYCPFCGEKT